MMSWRKSVVVGIAALTWGTRPFAGTHEIHRGQLKSQREATAVPSAAIQLDIDRTAKASPLGIAKVRLDTPPPGVKGTSAVLKFQMSNVSSSPLTDIVFEVSIVEEPQQAHFDTARRVLAGPFTIRGKVVLGPGYTADYEIRASQSATIAIELAKALSEQRLDAIAAQDPDEPDRFIAALFFADSQLLVVSARYASPSLLTVRLAQKQYRDVYLDLSASSIADSSVLFQDMNADGLCARRGQAADIVYDGGQAATLFDGDWDKHKSDKTYEQQFVAADQQYSRLLKILLAQLRGSR